MILFFNTESCQHSKIKESEKSEVWYCRNENSDKLKAYVYTYQYNTCVMCGKESRICLEEKRDELKDVDRSDIQRYKILLKTRLMEI